MAKKSTAPAPVVEEVAETATERDYTAFLEKEPTALIEHLGEWIQEKTGVTFGTKKELDAFLLGVKLTVNLRTYHQASDENQERLAEMREAAAKAAADKAERKAAKAAEPETEEAPAPAAAAPAAKGKKAKAATPAPVVEETPAPVAPAAKKGPRKAAGSKAPF